MFRLLYYSYMYDTKEIKIVAVSGGFDPVHIGHVRMFEEAKKLGTHLVVILNSDEWLKKKKGYVFMPEKERAELIKNFKPVDDVYIHEEIDEYMSVSGAIEKYRMNINGEKYQISVFANGGDRRNEEDIPEAEVCKKMGIEMVFNVGDGGKVQSSSWLVDKIRNRYEVDIRPWGHMYILESKQKYWVKHISVAPDKRLSLQTHSKRRELWACIEGEIIAEKGRVLKGGKWEIIEKKILKPGDTFYVKTGELHRISSKKGGTVIEVAFDNPQEEDIVRYEDDYGRV